MEAMFADNKFWDFCREERKRMGEFPEKAPD